MRTRNEKHKNVFVSANCLFPLAFISTKGEADKLWREKNKHNFSLYCARCLLPALAPPYAQYSKLNQVSSLSRERHDFHSHPHATHPPSGPRTKIVKLPFHRERIQQLKATYQEKKATDATMSYRHRGRRARREEGQ